MYSAVSMVLSQILVIASLCPNIHLNLKCAKCGGRKNSFKMTTTLTCNAILQIGLVATRIASQIILYLLSQTCPYKTTRLISHNTGVPFIFKHNTS